MLTDHNGTLLTVTVSKISLKKPQQCLTIQINKVGAMKVKQNLNSGKGE